MPKLPPIPSWDGLHPLIVHFPIGLLMTVPVLLVLGMIFRDGRRLFSIAAFVLMLLGTAAAYVGVESGEAAAELVERTPQVSAVLERHQELAETTRNLFTILTVVFAAILFVPSLLKSQLQRRVFVLLNLAFLIVYAAAALFVADTGHNGGRLVHELGVRALMSSQQTQDLPGR
jgi:uncharacterized membrane protein